MTKQSSETIADAPPAAERLAYTREELCAKTDAGGLGLSVVTLWRLEKRKLLVPVPGLRHKIYPRAAVERYLAGKAVA